MKESNFKFGKLVLIFVIFHSLACNKLKDENIILGNDYKLILQDSIVVNNLSRILIFDYDENKNLYLGFSRDEEMLVTLNTNGEIERKVDLKGDGPEKYGYYIRNLGIYKNQIAIITNENIIFYSNDFEKISEYPYNSSIFVQSTSPFAKTMFLGEEGEEILIINPNLKFDYYGNDGAIDTLKYIEYFNFEELKLSNEIEAFDNKSKENSIFFDFNTPIISINDYNETLYLTLPLSEKISVFERKNSKFNKIKDISLEIENFIKVDPLPLGTEYGTLERKQQFLNGSRIWNIINFSEDVFGLIYFKQFDSRLKSELIEESLNYSLIERYGTLELILYDNDVKISSEIHFPNGRFVTKLKENKFIIEKPENLEIEEDFTVYYIYQLISNKD
ncbi:hypothetical protein [Belliella pelovolcani]|uniref:6-bladed beta-propeller protein n=1 Tax=Belliella pelovolcani TaxID=529505 RepID=A0A1N7Q4R5_9BACT|nr:hypothetical protein [Belliella pelovolcani]SIT17848.1 hypothetical protein SAMN05421761_1307 [Belliella pelovolcani]